MFIGLFRPERAVYGEADAVFLFPDLSKAGDAAYQRHGAQRDGVIRLFYVGMTRARQTLYLCQRESSMAVAIRGKLLRE